MTVVSNTSPINYLTLIGLDRLLPAITAKVMVTSKVTIHGLGAHSGTGEEWAIDENALTRAEAQAFKRACSCFGLGRYF